MGRFFKYFWFSVKIKLDGNAIFGRRIEESVIVVTLYKNSKYMHKAFMKWVDLVSKKYFSHVHILTKSIF